MPKKALITGITGQDGSYLAELLLEPLHRLAHRRLRALERLGSRRKAFSLSYGNESF